MIAGLLILFVAGFVLGAGTLYQLMPYDDGTRALRAKGYPTTIEELEVWYPDPPEGENAAEYYLKAGAILGRSGALHPNVMPLLADVQRPPLDVPMSDETRSSVAAFLDREAAAFDLIDEASRFEHSRYPTVDAVGPILSQYMFDIWYAQQLRTLYYSRLGDAEHAVDQFERLAHWARSTGFEPSITSVTMFSTYADDTVKAAHQILNANELSNDQLARLDRALARIQETEFLVRAIVGDRCTTLARLSGYGRFRSDREVRVHYCDISDSFLAIAEKGLPENLDAFRRLHNRQDFSLASVAGLTYPAFDNAVSRFYETIAGILATRTAITIQVHRFAGGELPEGIEHMPADVFGDWPADPFSGEPLIYERMPTGFIVYSVGANLVDDGGRFSERLDAGVQVLR